MPILSVATSPTAPSREAAGSKGSAVPEVHLPSRPPLGRLDATRLTRAFDLLDLALQARFRRRLEAVCREHGATAVHGLTHTADFWPAFEVAETLGVPYFVSVHDDLEYALARHWGQSVSQRRLATVWREATHRFAISREMGEEYNRRYGARDFTVVTDGVTGLSAPRAPDPRSLRFYFAGLFHLTYRRNLAAMLEALRIIQRAEPSVRVSFTCRCGSISEFAVPDDVPFEILPYAPEAVIQDDLRSADYLYLPLPFDPGYEKFVRFSMSAKMVTYLGSGLPIAYHGPAAAAAGQILARHGAAVALNTLDPEAIASTLTAAGGRAEQVVGGAQELALAEFQLADHQRRFWSRVEPAARAAMAA